MDIRTQYTASHTRQLEILGRDLAEGSLKAFEVAYLSTYEKFEKLHGRRPNKSEVDQLIALFGFKSDTSWGIGPNGASEVFKDDEPQSEVISLSEFIGGIAVANDIDPTQADIDTVIFYIGKYYPR